MGRGGAPAWEISFVSLVAYGPKVSDSALAMGGLQLLKPDRAVPKPTENWEHENEIIFAFWKEDTNSDVK